MRTFLIVYINSKGNETQKTFHSLDEALSFINKLDKRIEKGSCFGYCMTQLNG